MALDLLQRRRPLALVVCLLVLIGVGGSLAAGPVLFQGGRSASTVRRVATILNLANWADSRLRCRLVEPNQLPLVHDETHDEIKTYGRILEAFLSDVTGPTHRAAIQALARVGANMTEFARQYPERMLDSADGSVRMAAADAIALSFADNIRDPLYGPEVLPPWDREAHAVLAHELIDRRIRQETIPQVIAVLLRAAAELPMDVTRLDQVQELLGRHLTGDPSRVLGALGGLEILTRRIPGRGFGVELSRRIRLFAEGDQRQLTMPRGGVPADLLPSLRRMSLLILHQSSADTEDTLLRAMQDDDWQVRRLAVSYLIVKDATVAAMVRSRLDDRSFQVRAAAIAALAPWMRSAHECVALFDALEDSHPAVVMAAIDVAPAGCQEHDRLIGWLRQKAELIGVEGEGRWHVPMRAVVALIRFGDPRTGALVLEAAKSSVWQVREQTADLAAMLKDDATALALAKDTQDADRSALVRAAGLRALTRLANVARVPLALESLRPIERRPIPGPLVLAALDALPATTPSVMLAPRLEAALGVATRSRVASLALIQRYAKLDVADSLVLRRLARGDDPVIAAAAAEALSTITGQRVVAEPHPAPGLPYAAVPGRSGPPPFATVFLSTGGSFKMQFYNNDAAVSVMWALSAGQANALFGTFFDVAPGVGAQASPFANAIDGVTTMRDELFEATHRRGSVALMSDGHDMANGRLFIDLIDRPDLNHAYTVIGWIISGLDAADAILPGTRVKEVRFSDR